MALKLKLFCECTFYAAASEPSVFRSCFFQDGNWRLLEEMWFYDCKSHRFGSER